MRPTLNRITFKRLQHTPPDGTKLLSESKYITAPIFYVNASPHIGHLYSTVLGDTLTRWHKLKKNLAYFSVGTDEHGLKIQQAAEQAKMDPLQFCDTVSLKFKVFKPYRADFGYNDSGLI